MKKINCPNVAKKLFVLLIVSLVFAIYFQSNAYALTSDNINFQGKIVRNDTGHEGLNVIAGTPACVVDGAGNDTCDFQVAYYTASSGGTLLLTETFSNVEIGQYDGVFELSLGSGSMTTTSQCRDGTCSTPSEVISEYKDLYVELKFAPDGTNLTETFSRMALEASPYAIFSKYAEGANDAFKLSTSVSSESQASPVTGMVYYNTTTSQLTVYDGDSWEGVQSSLWTDAGTFTYLTSTTDDLILGATTVADSTFFFDMDASSGSYLEIDDASNTNRLFTILSGGNVGIGTATPGAKLEVAGSSSTITNASGDLTISTGGLNGNIIFSPNGTGRVRANSPFGIRETGTTPTFYTYFQGGDQSADVTYTLPTGDGTTSGQVLTTNASGILSWQTVATGSTAWDDILDPDSNSAIVHGGYSTDMQFDTFTSGSAFKISSAATGLTGSLLDVSLTGSNAANTGSLFALNNTGTANTNTSFLINHYATGTGNLAFRVNDVSGDTSPFVINGDGSVGIGISSPTAALHLRAGTATAGTAPLKFSTGTNLGTAESGAMEWDGSRLYMTNTTPTRNTLAYTSDFVRTDSTSNIAAVGYTGTTQTSGYLYGGATVPTNNTYALNYSGTFRATQLYEGNNRVLTSVNWSQISNGTGVYMDYKPNNTACTGGQVLKYTVGTGWLCADDNAGTGGDNWGTQVAITNSSLTGDGTSGTPLGINLGNFNIWTAAQTFRSIVLDTATSTDDRLLLNVNSGGAARFDGTLTNTDLTAARAWNLPDATGTLALLTDIPAGATYWTRAGSTLYPTTSGDSVLPNGTAYLGSDSARWADIYLGPNSIHIGSSVTDEGVISYDTTSNILRFDTDSTTNGDMSFFSDDLYIDKSTSRVGIGTTGPAAKLEIATSTSTTDKALYVHQFENSGTMYAGVFEANGSGGTNNIAGYFSAANATNNYGLLVANGNVGIGTTTPSNKFVVNTSSYSTIELLYGGTSVVDIFSNASSNIFIGLDSGSVISTGTGNIALGDNALSANTTGLSNTAIGHYALDSNVAKQGSTALGYQAMMYANSTATAGLSYNTAIGYQALTGSGIAANNTGTQNTAVGHQSMTANTSGSSNTALGVNTLNANTTGTENIAIGQNALFTNVAKQGSVAIGFEAMRYAHSSVTASLSYNTAVGYQALMGSSTPANNLGDRNTVFGYQSGMNMTSGDSNTLMGVQAGYSNTTGYSNVAIGADSLSANATGTGNVVIGRAALGTNATGDHSDSVAIGYKSMGEAGGGTAGNVGLGQSTLFGVSGNYNTALGYGAGQDLTNGSYNILIGYNVQASTITSSNELNIGNTIYGNLSNDYISIGDSTPTEGMFTVGATSQFRIDTNGDLTRIKDVPYTWPSSNASGILANNGSGALSWSTLASLGGVTGTGAGTATAGQITWWNGTSTITGENDFYWDASNNRLGIGTSTPTASIDIAGASSTISNASGDITITPANNLIVYSGNVGIGDETPASLLTVGNGDLFQVRSTGELGIGVAPSTSYSIYTTGRSYGINAEGSSRGGRFYDTDGTSVTYVAYGSYGLYTAQNGYFGSNVGIRTTSANNPLSVVSPSSSVSAIQFGLTATAGGYLMSSYDHQFNISGGARYTTGALWEARSTTASIIGSYNGELMFYNNTGLTVGSTFTPTERMRIDSSGSVGIGTTPISTANTKLHVYSSSTLSNMVVSSSDYATVNIMSGNGSGQGFGNFSINAYYDGSTWTKRNTSYESWIMGIATRTDSNGRIDFIHSDAGAGFTMVKPMIIKPASVFFGDYLEVFSGNSKTVSTPFIRADSGNNLVLNAYSTGGVFVNRDATGSGGFYVGDGAGTGSANYVFSLARSAYNRGRIYSQAYDSLANSTNTYAGMEVGPYRVAQAVSSNTLYEYYSNASSVAYRIMTTGTAMDLAEWYPVGNIDLDTNGNSKLKKGEILCLDNNDATKVVKCDSTHTNVVGIVSTASYTTMGIKDMDDLREDDVEMALTGRVPAIVTSKNGPIAIGDFITYSDLRGVGQKATSKVQVVAKALDTFNPSSCSPASSLESISWPVDENGDNPTKPCYQLPDGTYVGKIMVFPNISVFNPSETYTTKQLINNGWYRIAQLNGTDANAKFKIKNNSVGSYQNLLLNIDTVSDKDIVNIVSNFTSGGYDISKARINNVGGIKYLEIYLEEVNSNSIVVNIDGQQGDWISTSITQVIDIPSISNEFAFNGVLFGISDVLQVEDTGLKVGGDLVASTTANIGDTTSRWNDIYAKGAIRLGSGSGQEGAIRFNTESKRLELSNDGSTWVQLGDLTSQMVISPEYPGAILFADGSDNLGKMTSDAIEENATFKNYYEWISNKEVAQDYDILVRITLPNDFVSWKDDAIYLDYMTQNSVSVENNSVDVTLIGNSGVDAQSVDHISTLPGAWERMSLKSLDINDCNAPGDSCTLRISLTSSMEYFTRVGDITLNYNRSL